MPEVEPDHVPTSDLPELATRESSQPPPTYTDATESQQPNTTRVVRQSVARSPSSLSSLCHIYIFYTIVQSNDKSDTTAKRITLTSSSTFEDFQLQLRQLYLELPSTNRDKAFTWSTWYYPGNDKNVEAAERTLVCEENWKELKKPILKMRSEKVPSGKGWESGLRLRTTVVVARWAERQRVKDITQLRVPTAKHKANESLLLAQGRYVAEPVVDEKGCVIM
ncbi:hypothetical protein HII31_06923 [Pseudocercospora fuligena]|uniref:Uncharacterized protein n=1 Tax=Pseudocercospora fuligena TaxID=685502 RepID=A0A8H6VGV4_9PEZI|nr:hypothetical protein HII31_06923 [Pseudocercospora fuligena]